MGGTQNKKGNKERNRKGMEFGRGEGEG